MKQAATDASRAAVDPALVVEAIYHAITSAKPKTRYVIGKDAKMRLWLNYLSDRKKDNLIMKKINSYKT